MNGAMIKLAGLKSRLPGRRYNIFAGTSRWDEWLMVLKSYAGSAPYDDALIIKSYEEAFAAAAGTRYAYSFGSGRMALYVILEALGIDAGAEVIIPAFTCVVVPNALLYRGLRPVYVDIDPVTFNIDPLAVERAITARTKAIYAQHTFGVVCEIDRLRSIADRHGLPLIEDAAHALGATCNEKKAGSLGDVAFFSTDHSKVINTMLGGMITTNNQELAARVAVIQARTPFLPRKQVRGILRAFLTERVFFASPVLWIGQILQSVCGRLGLFFFFDDELELVIPTKYPYPCRLSSVQAQIGLSQLEGLDRNLAHRRSLATWLESRVAWYRGTVGERIGDQSWLRYSFLVRDRDQFVRRFRRYFDLGLWFTSIAQGRMRDLETIGYVPGTCPTAEKVTQHIVNIPTHERIPVHILERLWEEHGNWISDNRYPLANHEEILRK